MHHISIHVSIYTVNDFATIFINIEQSIDKRKLPNNLHKYLHGCQRKIDAYQVTEVEKLCISYMEVVLTRQQLPIGTGFPVIVARLNTTGNLIYNNILQLCIYVLYTG